MHGHHFSADPLTLAIEDRDHSEWRRGRERYAVWMIDADIPELRERVDQARQHLSGLLAPSQRQPHITLFVCGFPAERREHDDDFDDAMFAAQCNALESLSCEAFELRIGRLSSFDLSAFFEVDDPDDAVSRMRARLAGVCRELRFAPYVPHLTVGLYRDAFDKRDIAARLDRFETTEIILPVRAIHLATYAARDIGGSLSIVETQALR